MMKPGQFVKHKLTGEQFLFLGGGEKDEQKLGVKVIVRDNQYQDRIFYDFELEEENINAG